MTDESTLPENAPTEQDVRDTQEAAETVALAGQPADPADVEAARSAPPVAAQDTDAGAVEPSEGLEAPEAPASTESDEASDDGPGPGQPAHPDDVAAARMRPPAPTAQ